MAAVPTASLSDGQRQELLCTYAALILSDEGLEISAENIQKLVSASGGSVESYLPGLFARALQGHNITWLVFRSSGLLRLRVLGLPVPHCMRFRGECVRQAEELSVRRRLDTVWLSAFCFAARAPWQQQLLRQQAARLLLAGLLQRRRAGSLRRRRSPRRRRTRTWASLSSTDRLASHRCLANIPLAACGRRLLLLPMPLQLAQTGRLPLVSGGLLTQPACSRQRQLASREAAACRRVLGPEGFPPLHAEAFSPTHRTRYVGAFDEALLLEPSSEWQEGAPSALRRPTAAVSPAGCQSLRAEGEVRGS
ncbi:hypothetical protein Efla_004993 [Eimeria flavescens]